jgi:hypothetical protein
MRTDTENLDLAPKTGKRVRNYDEWKTHPDYMLRPPTLDAGKMSPRLVEWNDWLPPILLLAFKTPHGKTVHLCDYASAGEAGTPYLSWLPIRNAPRAEFSRGNPLRSGRVCT